ncbi:AEC family transporter [Enterococcus sp. 5H]|uniref:AEC family transporter n=1 Tax=Enterococcus sp. 5H TaxID=1229490 RepID=UPI00230407B9|nr:transporter [Enterococcus sp. 5H]MDA9470492.1 putative permease [Enterococcus sp. 5H]
MKEILVQAGAFCFMIFLGFLMKRIGLLSKADGGTLSIIIVNITLPATVIVSLANVAVSGTLFFLLIMGIIMNILVILIGSRVSKKRSILEQQFQMYSMSGYNIGNFSLPFIQGFYPLAVPFLLMFDIGNSVMLTGGSTLLIDKMIGSKKETSAKRIVLSLLRSVPFTAYLVMLLLRIGDINLPLELLAILELIAKANGFLSMFMIGLYFEVRLPKRALHLVKEVLFWRYLCGGILALLFAFVIPLNPMLRIVLVVLSVAPMPTFSVINSVKAGMPEETVGFTSSASILISLVLMTLVMMLMG